MNMVEPAGNKFNWYNLSPEQVAQDLQVELKTGLQSSEAQQRLKKFGPNRLEEKKKEPGWQAFLRQYQDLMQIVLLVAAIINQIFTGEWGTTLVLIALTILNAVLG
jgi:Ca2+-transporting ATPase